MYRASVCMNPDGYHTYIASVYACLYIRIYERVYVATPVASYMHVSVYLATRNGPGHAT